MTLSKNKLPGLEVLRFVAAVAVLIWHYQHFFYVAYKPVGFVREQQPFYSVLSFIYAHGSLGVQVFWCISGFIFYLKYRDLIASKAVGWRKFFVLRFSRLYPLHFVTLLLVVALQALYLRGHGYFFVYEDNDFPGFVQHLFMVSGWFMGRLDIGGFNGPVWSVSVEVLIYSLFFLGLRYITKSFWLPIAAIILFFVARTGVSAFPVLKCFFYFYVGGLVAILFDFIGRTPYSKIANLAAFILSVGLPVLFYALGLYRSEGIVIAFVTAYVPVLIYFLARDFKLPPTLQKGVEVAGNMTYASYLFHFPLQLSIMLVYTALGLSIPYYSRGFFLFFIFTTLLASIPIYRYFELPAQNYIRRKFK